MPKELLFSISEREGELNTPQSSIESNTTRQTDKRRVACRHYTGVKTKNVHVSDQTEALIVEAIKQGLTPYDIAEKFKTHVRKVQRIEKAFIRKQKIKGGENVNL